MRKNAGKMMKKSRFEKKWVTGWQKYRKMLKFSLYRDGKIGRINKIRI
jgi:hypothetical protein